MLRYCLLVVSDVPSEDEVDGDGTDDDGTDDFTDDDVCSVEHDTSGSDDTKLDPEATREKRTGFALGMCGVYDTCFCGDSAALADSICSNRARAWAGIIVPKTDTDTVHL